MTAGPTLGCSTGGTLNFYSIIINLLNFPHVDEHVTNKSSFFFYFLGFIIYICSRDFSWMCFFVNMRHASGPDCFCSMYGLLIFNTANRRDIMDMGALISPYETKKCKNISKCIILFISIYPYHTFPLQFTSVFQTLYVVGSFLFMPSNPFILNLIQGVFIHKIQPLEGRDNERHLISILGLISSPNMG